MMHLLYLEKGVQPTVSLSGLRGKGPEMAARQEVRLKDNDPPTTKNRQHVAFAVPTVMYYCRFPIRA
jgi:hypothetical protein